MSRRSMDYFKRAAKTRRAPYQRMIRALADQYAGQGEMTASPNWLEFVPT